MLFYLNFAPEKKQMIKKLSKLLKDSETKKKSLNSKPLTLIYMSRNELNVESIKLWNIPEDINVWIISLFEVTLFMRIF